MYQCFQKTDFIDLRTEDESKEDFEQRWLVNGSKKQIQVGSRCDHLVHGVLNRNRDDVSLARMIRSTEQLEFMQKRGNHRGTEEFEERVQTRSKRKGTRATLPIDHSYRKVLQFRELRGDFMKILGEKR